MKRELVGYQGPREKREEVSVVDKTDNEKRAPGRPRKMIEEAQGTAATTSIPGVSVDFPAP